MLEDVLDEKLSLEYARQHYGVVIDLEREEVDWAPTEQLRRERAAAGG